MKNLKPVLYLGLVLLACTASGNELATFGKQKITVENFKQALDRLGPQAQMVKSNPEMRERFIDHLINNKLLAEKATNEKVENDPKFKEMFEAAKQDLLAKFYIDKYLDEKLSDANLKAEFEKDKQKYAGGEVKAQHILVKEEKKAKDLLAQAKKGADFTALAKKNSTEPGADKSGGDLGYFGRGQMVPAFEEAAFKGKKGEVYPEVVKTQFGFHVIKVNDIKDGTNVDFATVKEKMKQQLRGESIGKLIEDLRKNANVSIKTEKLKELKL